MPSLRVLAVGCTLAVLSTAVALSVAEPSFADTAPATVATDAAPVTAPDAAAATQQAVTPIQATVAATGVSHAWLRSRRLSGVRATAPTSSESAALSRNTAGPAIGLPINPAELSATELTRALDMAAAAGVSNVSAGATWWFLTENRGPRQYDWSTLDRLVAGAKTRGMTVTLQLTGTPDWVHPELVGMVSDKYSRIWYPPTSASGLAAFRDFAADVAAHFTSGVARIELWNEPNLQEFFRTGPNPDQFAAMVRAGYLGVKSANPRIIVTTGGVSRNDVGFTTRTIQALNAYPDAAGNHGFFDEIGVHPYSNDRGPNVNDPRYVHTGPFGLIDDNFLGLTRMAALAGSRKLYVGEYGFSTTTTWMPAVPDATRAEYLTQALALIQGMPAVAAFTWYHYMPTSSDSPSWSIVDSNGTPSLTYKALVAANKTATTSAGQTTTATTVQ